VPSSGTVTEILTRVRRSPIACEDSVGQSPPPLLDAQQVWLGRVCEPTGHRWRVLGQLAADRGMLFVCVQPLVSSWSRRSEDLMLGERYISWFVVVPRD
jgi:hypothetical protein